MATIKFFADVRATPAQYLAALTDFGPGRAEVFPNSADEALTVIDLGDDYADVTEGAGGVWETLHYDWSNPDHVVLRTTDSNAWGGESGHFYDFKILADGSTALEYTVVREGKNARGYFLQFVLSTVGRTVLAKAFRNSVEVVERRAAATAA